jgi:putative tryptophan/tyrosine transport system substrate-binding protein
MPGSQGWTRRQVVQGMGAVGLALLVGCGRWPGQVQSQAAVYRVGYLGPAPRETRSPPPPGVQPLIESFREGLRTFGYVEGHNLLFEWRGTPEGPERLLELAAELVQLPVDIIVTSAAPATQAAQRATSTIPIVFGNRSAPCAWTRPMVCSLVRG